MMFAYKCSLCRVLGSGPSRSSKPDVERIAGSDGLGLKSPITPLTCPPNKPSSDDALIGETAFKLALVMILLRIGREKLNFLMPFEPIAAATREGARFISALGESGRGSGSGGMVTVDVVGTGGELGEGVRGEVCEEVGCEALAGVIVEVVVLETVPFPSATPCST